MELLKNKTNIIEDNSEKSKKVKPFLKWAGGKSQLLSELEKFYPFNYFNIKKYAEPFIGGGAVLFDLINKYEISEIYISDTNKELIEAYLEIKNNVEELINSLFKLQEEFLMLNLEERKKYYNLKRKRFNELKNKSDTNLEKVTLLIFLNKTCFNGLYRVNKKGEFNVPMGNYKNPLICDFLNLRLVSEKLKKINIVYGDYKKSIEFIDENTFVYFDPPYRPLSNTSNFTSYSEECFDDKNQIELANFFIELDKIGAKLLLSNSDPKNMNEEDNFFDELYKNFNIKRINANRMINSKSSNRGKIKELLISNFKLGE